MSHLAFAAFCLLLAAAAATDIASYRIPNILPLLVGLGAVVFVCPQTAAELASRGAAVLLVGGACFGGYLLRGLGGGDVKLLTAIALWTPLASLPEFLLPLAVAGGIQALATLGYRQLVSTVFTAAPRMPYAVSIAAGGFAWAILQGR
jgi:prepilin peptidase CpaA